MSNSARLGDKAGAAEYLNTSADTIERLIQTGKLPIVRLPVEHPSGANAKGRPGVCRRVLIDIRDLDRIIAEAEYQINEQQGRIRDLESERDTFRELCALLIEHCWRLNRTVAAQRYSLDARTRTDDNYSAWHGGRRGDGRRSNRDQRDRRLAHRLTEAGRRRLAPSKGPDEHSHGDDQE